MTFVTLLVNQSGVLVSFGVFPASNSDADFDPVLPQVSHFFVKPVIDVCPLVGGFDDQLGLVESSEAVDHMGAEGGVNELRYEFASAWTVTGLVTQTYSVGFSHQNTEAVF